MPLHFRNRPVTPIVFRATILLGIVTLISACDRTPPAAPTSTPTEILPNQSSIAARPASPKVSTSPSPVNSDGSAGTEFRFRDMTREWKLDFTRYNDARGLNRVQEAMGGGAALFDFDLDGLLDAFFTQGARLPRGTASPEFTNELFRNTGQLTRVTEAAGLTSHGYYTGCAVGDVDDDGFPDLYVTAYGRTTLWHNNGDGTFGDVTDAANVMINSWSTSAILADFNGDGFLDLFVATYLAAEDDPPKICKSAQSPTGTVQCAVALYPALDDVLLINDGQGGYVDVTREAGIVGRDGKGLGAVATDIDGDGQLEIFVANDGTPCFLYKKRDGGGATTASGIPIPHFEERGAEFGVAQNGEGAATAAMGIAHGDYDRDGWIDLLVTNFYLEPNTLFHNDRGSGFSDFSAPSRLGPPSRKTLAFGTEFLDIDCDGWLDLIVTTGHIEDRTWAGKEPYSMCPHLFRNERNGKFTDVATSAGPYFQSQWVGRGLAIGDLDRDGDIDLVVSHQEGPSTLLLNDTPSGSGSVMIRTVGRNLSPRNGIGIRVVATGATPVLTRDVAGGGSYQSASAQEIHLGLAGRTEFEELQLTWPDGHVDRWRNVEAGFYVAVERRGFYRMTATH